MTIPAAALLAGRAIAVQKEQPNIIIILADDLGFRDIGYQGAVDIPTPAIDSIAEKGVRFTDGYSCDSVCAPSRAGFITGKYQQRFGFEDNIGPFRKHPDVIPGLPLEEKTIGDHFRKLGYATGLIGKWHLGESDKRLLPCSRGFDQFFGHLGGASAYFINKNKEKLLFRNYDLVKEEKEYLTDAFGREASLFIKTNKDRPFLLYLAFNAPHGPLQAPEETLKKFKHIENEKRRVFASMVYHLDKNIGLVLETLKNSGLERKSLIFFFSDNGGETKQSASDNAPLRGQKNQYYEGGIRVPFCAQWKGALPEGKAYSNPITARDILPTALAAAGVNNTAFFNFDGVNLLPFLLGENMSRPHTTLFWKKYGGFAVRHLDWKLVAPDNKEGTIPELYDLSKDISEKNNLASEDPGRVKDMQKMFDAWQKEMQPPLFGWQTSVGQYKVKLEKYEGK